MPLHRHYSLEHSDKVLKQIAKALAKSKLQIVVDQWANGREQGYHLSVSGPDAQRDCCFAQQRNSDTVVVVFGKPRQFDITTNMPDDEAWSRMVELYPDRNAVASIVAWMKDGTEPRPVAQKR